MESQKTDACSHRWLIADVHTHKNIYVPLQAITIRCITYHLPALKLILYMQTTNFKKTVECLFIMWVTEQLTACMAAHICQFVAMKAPYSTQIKKQHKLTLSCHSATCRWPSQWTNELLLPFQSAQTRSPSTRAHPSQSAHQHSLCLICSTLGINSTLHLEISKWSCLAQ